jgi:hypothetical protein
VNRFQFVADHQQRYGVKRLCQIVKVARSSYYYWRSTALDRAARDAADAALAVRIRAVRAAHDGTYGAPRITAELHDNGVLVNHKKVARVMRRYRIQGLRLRRRVQTTIADPSAVKAPDLIGRDFTAGAVNQRYVGDITYLPVGERGFLYLATVTPRARRRPPAATTSGRSPSASTAMSCAGACASTPAPCAGSASWTSRWRCSTGPAGSSPTPTPYASSAP